VFGADVTVVGKAIRHLTETAHILTPAPTSTLSAFSTTQIATYMRRGDASTHACTELMGTHQVNLDATGQPDRAQLPTL